MDKITVLLKHLFVFFVVTAGGFSFASCDKDDERPAPRITEIRRSTGAVLGAPKGVGIQILGEGLTSPTSVNINGYEMNMNTVWTADESIFLTIPHGVPNLLDQPVPDLLKVTTAGGMATFSFAIIPGVPAVTGVSNPRPAVGETITLEGSNFYYIECIVFPAVTPVRVTDFIVSADGSAITVKVPNGFDQECGGIEIQSVAGRTTLEPPLPVLHVTNLRYGSTVSTAYAAWIVKEDFQLLDDPYCDRPAASAVNAITQIPDNSLIGATLLRTSVDARAYTGADPLVLFEIDREAEVIVVFNQGGQQALPAWLSEANGWIADDPARADTNKAIRNNVATPDTFWLYRKTFPAGEVALYRNGENSSGAGINTTRSPYFVLIK